MLNFSTYEQAKAVMGKTLETPIGMLPVTGVGHSGDKVTVSFGFAVDVVNGVRCQSSQATWTTDHGFETLEVRKARIWDADLMSRTKDEISLLNAVFGSKLTADDRCKLKPASKLVDVAKRQLMKAGKLEAKTCGRCYGSGRYSFNRIDGDRCYGCNGSGKTMPTTCEALAAATA